MKIVSRIVRNKRGLIAAFPHLNVQNGGDINQEMYLVIAKAWEDFSVSKAASTYIGGIVGRRIIDLYRRAKSQAKSEQEFYRRRGESYTDEESGNGSTPTLAEWVAGVCLAARRMYADRLWARQGIRGAGKDSGRGIVGYSLDQLLGLYALQARLKLKPFGVYTMLQEFPELRRALRLRKPLPVKTVYRLLDRAQREVDKCGFSLS